MSFVAKEGAFCVRKLSTNEQWQICLGSFDARVNHGRIKAFAHPAGVHHPPN